MGFTRRASTGAICLFFLLNALPADQKFALTIDSIMRGPGLYGYEPNDVRWSGDSQRVYFRWKQAADPQETPLDTYVVNRDGSGLRKLSEEQARLTPPFVAQTTRDHKRAVWTQNGDLYFYDYTPDMGRQLTKTAEAETNPHFSFDEKRVTFLRGGNLYALTLDSGALEQLTEVDAGGGTPKPARIEDKGTDSQEFLKKQEKELLATVRERASVREAREKREHPRKPLKLEPRQSITSAQLTPDGKSVLVLLKQTPEKAEHDNVPNFITESAYTEEIPGRTNAGDLQDGEKAAIIDVVSGESKPIDLGLANRDVELQEPLFNEQGTRVVMVARAADNKDRWILALDLAAAKAKPIFTEHDDAWVNNFVDDSAAWLKNGEDVYFRSEKDGYLHLYRVPANGDGIRQLTSGKFEVTDAELSLDGSKFYLTTSEVGPGERQFYSMGIDGGARTRITQETGKHEAEVSPDQQYLAEVYSYTNKPPELFIQENRPNAPMKKLTDSPAKDFWEYPWLDVPTVQVPARDGTKIPARFFKPANYQRGGPAVVFVHGSGYAQNVHNYWASYSREYLFHNFLREHGYMVLDMDYRASSGYGRAWRTAIYRHMGGVDLDDNVDGAKFLVDQGADPKRIGIYGGSYGGFITLMAMFTTPDVFAAGAALRPVTDWSHYNNGYTSNILNTPQKDEEAYRKSSPIYFAQNLKGALLICHGMVDTNVFFQDTVRLVQRLIELRKDNWSVAMYPVENHGFVQPTSWADEYKRIFSLFETNLKKGS
jgi:dipeptidyl aminopeptidase/acylaminoacyl peptidase